MAVEKRYDLTGKQINNWLVLEELGGGKIKCQCQCENKTEKILYKKAVKEGKTKSCGCYKNDIYNRIQENLVNKQFGEWTVTKELGQGKVLCRCSCGTVREVYKRALKEGKSKSCGCTQKRKISVGQQFGEWTVIDTLEKNKQYKCLCRCSCGVEKEVFIQYLINGVSKSCGHILKNENDITGQQFGEWTVLKRADNGKYTCKCACGIVKDIYKKSLINGDSKSCGCKREERRHNTYKEKNKGFIGQRFGDWEVIDYSGDRKLKCKCICGKITDVYKQALLTGKSKSCGCESIKYSFESSLMHYGDITGIKKESPRELWQIQALYNKDFLIEVIDILSNYTEKPTIRDLASELGISEAHTLRIIHKFDLEDSVDIRPSYSSYEKELVNYIKTINRNGYKIISNTRDVVDNYELDIYIPEKKIAIEFNGDYWHSELKKDKNYHQKKTIACAKQGIHLIHIFEHEWLDDVKKEKIKNILKNEIYGIDNKVYARNTSVSIASQQEIKEFEEKYHMQGYTPSSINIKLSLNNDILGIMTFGKPRFNSKFEYELIRLCYRDDIKVIGGSQKMFKYFVKKYNPQSIISYCSIDKFIGSVYRKLGFKTSIEMITEPNYIWINLNKRDILNRYQTQKHKLIEKGLGNLGDTESEIMQNLGYVRIHDCGNLKFYWNNN